MFGTVLWDKPTRLATGAGWSLPAGRLTYLARGLPPGAKRDERAASRLVLARCYALNTVPGTPLSLLGPSRAARATEAARSRMAQTLANQQQQQLY